MSTLRNIYVPNHILHQKNIDEVAREVSAGYRWKDLPDMRWVRAFGAALRVKSNQQVSYSYRFGVEWIALNDNAGNGDSAEDVAGYISTALLADLFGVDTSKVAADIMRVRERESK